MTWKASTGVNMLRMVWRSKKWNISNMLVPVFLLKCFTRWMPNSVTRNILQSCCYLADAGNLRQENLPVLRRAGHESRLPCRHHPRPRHCGSIQRQGNRSVIEIQTHFFVACWFPQKLILNQIDGTEDGTNIFINAWWDSFFVNNYTLVQRVTR